MRPLLLLLALVLMLTGCASQNSTLSVKEELQNDNAGFSPRVEQYLSMTPRPVIPTPTPTAEVRTFRVSFYSDGDRTALGIPTSRGVAAVAYSRDTYKPVIPFGTRIHLEGIGEVTVLDTCPACEEHWIDMYEPSRERAIELGVMWISGTIERP